MRLKGFAKVSLCGLAFVAGLGQGGRGRGAPSVVATSYVAVPKRLRYPDAE